MHSFAGNKDCIRLENDKIYQKLISIICKLKYNLLEINVNWCIMRASVRNVNVVSVYFALRLAVLAFILR